MDNSPFGRLSPELRNRIYSLVFDEGPVTGPDEPSLGVYTFQPAAALTQTCRTIRKESRAMFYFKKKISRAIRCDKHAQNLCQFFEVLGTDIICNLHSLKVLIRDPKLPEWFEGGMWVTGRKEITFSADESAHLVERPYEVVRKSRGSDHWRWKAEPMIIETLAKLKVRFEDASGWDAGFWETP